MNKRFISALLVLVMVILSLASCGIFGTDDPDAEGEKIRVMVTCSEGVRVIDENPKDVLKGSDAEFTIELDGGYALDSVSGAKLVGDVITVSDVQRRTVVKVKAVSLGYDTSEEYRYYFSGAEGDTSSVANASKVNAGTMISVSANDRTRAFLGWSIGSYTNDVDNMISTDREFSFRLSPDMVNKSGVFKLYANYAELNSYYYDLNGGSVYSGGVNLSASDYYTVAIDDERVKVTVGEDYLSVSESVSLFYDDGSFRRDGYVLVEYNTEPDGSGEGYSLGSKFFTGSATDAIPVLYCIWDKTTSSSEFAYEYCTQKKPSSATHADSWCERGYMITSYFGDSERVVIPEQINGVPVIAIKGGAFKNKSLDTLVLPKTLQLVEDGAFVGCPYIETIYYPDSIYSISNDAFDKVSYTSLHKLIVNATMAPRYANTEAGAFSVKLSRILASMEQNRIILIAGSSSYQGFSSEYAEALFDNEYRVVNFGTTRTTNGIIYLEAMASLAHDGDIVLFAPENSTYMMGETELYWKTARDMELMYNLYRYIDISQYTNVFFALSDFNINYRYNRAASRYEDIVKVIKDNRSISEYGEYMNPNRTGLSNYVDAYFLTFNERYKSKYDVNWNDVGGQISNKDYTDPYNKTWESINSERLAGQMNRAISLVKDSGARVYFSFCPADADKLVDEAKNIAWLDAYDRLIEDTYVFDGIVGSCKNYIFAHKYFYDCAFHPNDYGRTFRTYRLYVDLCEILGVEAVGFLDRGTDFEGCLFEPGCNDGEPLTSVEYLD